MFGVISCSNPVIDLSLTEGHDRGEENGILYYSLNENNEFVLMDNISTARALSTPTFNFPEYSEFTVDGIATRFKVTKVTLNEEETAKQPYSNLTRIASIANGQVYTETKTFDYSKSVSISNIGQKSKEFSFGGGGQTKGLLGKIINLTIGNTFGGNYSTRISSTNTSNSLTKITNSSAKTLSIPNLPEFKECNGADFYNLTTTSVYDIEAVIDLPDTTNSKYLGYTDLRYTSKYGYGSDYYCRICSEKIDGLDIRTPFPDDPRNEDEPGDSRIVHIELASGDTGHCSLSQWEQMNRYGRNPYKSYCENNGTEVSFRLYWANTLAATVPWLIESNDKIPFNKPVSLVPDGVEKIIYNNGKYYKMVIEDSHLTDFNYSINLPGDQLDPIPEGMVQTYKETRTVTKTDMVEQVLKQSGGLSRSFKVSIFNFLRLNGGSKRSMNISNTSSTTISESDIVEINNTFKMPQSYIDSGYDGACIYVTESGLSYEITAKIYPLNSLGEADTSKEESITMIQKVEFPKIFAKPYKVLK